MKVIYTLLAEILLNNEALKKLDKSVTEKDLLEANIQMYELRLSNAKKRYDIYKIKRGEL